MVYSITKIYRQHTTIIMRLLIGQNKSKVYQNRIQKMKRCKNKSPSVSGASKEDTKMAIVQFLTK